jgi:hypothetical protein
MRKITLFVATSLTLLPFTAWAQQAPGTVGNSPPPAGDIAPPPAMGVGAPPRGEAITPQPGSPLLPGTQTGLDKVAEDGFSTKTIKAVPCTTFARETDGTTTCVGIPDEPARKRR